MLKHYVQRFFSSLSLFSLSKSRSTRVLARLVRNSHFEKILLINISWTLNERKKFSSLPFQTLYVLHDRNKRKRMRRIYNWQLYSVSALRTIVYKMTVLYLIKDKLSRETNNVNTVDDKSFRCIITANLELVCSRVLLTYTYILLYV